MKLIIDKGGLAASLKAVGATVARGGMPAAQCVLIEAGENAVFETTDMTSATRVAVPGLAEEPGLALVGYEQLARYAGMLDDAAVAIEADGESCRVSCGKTVFEMKALPPEDFPGFADIDGGESISIRAEDFAAGVAAVLPTVGKDQNSALSGVRISCSGAQAVFDATNGYAAHRLEVPCQAGAPLGCTLPVKMCKAVAAAGLAGDAAVRTDGRRVSLESDAYKITCRMVEGTYPSLDRLLRPSGEAVWATFRSDALKHALKRATAAMSSGCNGVKLVLRPDGMDLRAAGDGTAYEDAAACEADGCSEVMCNPSMLLTAVSSMPRSAECRLALTGRGGPLFVDGDGYRAVVMPVKWR